MFHWWPTRGNGVFLDNGSSCRISLLRGYYGEVRGHAAHVENQFEIELAELACAALHVGITW